MSSNKPTLCWFCAKLGKCQVLRPCKDFVKYKYGRKTKDKKRREYISTYRVGELCGVTQHTICRWLKNDSQYALAVIKARTGLSLEYVETKGGRHKFVKKEKEA